MGSSTSALIVIVLCFRLILALKKRWNCCDCFINKHDNMKQNDLQRIQLNSKERFYANKQNL